MQSLIISYRCDNPIILFKSPVACFDFPAKVIWNLELQALCTFSLLIHRNLDHISHIAAIKTVVFQLHETFQKRKITLGKG